MFTNKIKWSYTTRGPWYKENTRYEFTTQKQKVILQIKKVIENMPRLGQGKAEVRHRKPQLTESITASTSKSFKIPKISTTQNVAKNRMDFPAQEQSITNKTEAITRAMIQDKNRE